MLSPHEFATLMLVKSSPEQIDMDRKELDTLLEQQLVSLESLSTGMHRPCITDHGEFLLEAIMRKR
ncbi:hypothetical protein P5W99_27635 [Paraburkholderia sp. A3BS-1L]|uniref:hypothetical protein n=1 Tax=Paraburkholderia sp. A3BS-1L TaxID=3028375 RepID=UPI003DA8EB0B